MLRGSSGRDDALRQVAVFLDKHAVPAGARAVEDVVAENEKLRDLLRRIRLSSEDGTLDIPQVRHGFEAEIREAVGE